MQTTMCCMPPYVDNEDALTQTTYMQYMYRIERVALNAVRWDGLPETVRQMVIERYLYYYGNAVFFKDEILDQYFVLPITAEYDWDVDHYPIEYDVTDWRGRRWHLSKDNSVIIWNNYQRVPSIPMAQLFATRLTNTMRTSDNHLEAQRIGKIIVAPENKRRGVKALLDRVKGFHLFTIVSPAAAELSGQVTVLDTELDYIGDKIDNHYSFIWHDCMQYFGITSTSDKKSGMTAEEIMSENDTAISGQGALLNSREDAVKEINKMFGLNISVTSGRRSNGELYDNLEISPGIMGRDGSTGDGRGSIEPDKSDEE